MKKKVLALVMAAAMTFGTMGMSTVAFAAAETTTDNQTIKEGVVGVAPTEKDDVTVTVKNVAPGMDVTAYQIVKAKYNTSGFLGYEKVNNEVGVADPNQPKASEVAAIVKGGFAGLSSVKMDWDPETKNYTKKLTAGYWIINVTGKATDGTLNVYNPMLAGVYYSKGGSNNEMTTDHVDASSKWSLVGDTAWAKHSGIPFVKNASVATANKGQVVDFDIPTTVPEYSNAYKKVEFEITDIMTNLELQGGVEVYYGTKESLGDKITDGVTVETGEDAGVNADGEALDLRVTFTENWIKANPGKNIVVMYSAKTIGEAVNFDPHKNEATLTYTHKPDGSTDGKTDEEKIYTFDIDGDFTGEVLKKVEPGKTEGEDPTPLAGAQFTLYTDLECTKVYTNDIYTDGAVAVSQEDNEETAVNEAGRIHFTGLDAGTYYLKETAAPEGYTLNNTVYMIEIKDLGFEGEELKNWKIYVTNMTTNDKMENTFSATNKPIMNTTNIVNTTMSELPSTGGIGTTIFTIGGCVIMIAAAGIFFVSRKKENEAK